MDIYNLVCLITLVMKLVSACLLGVKCSWNGGDNKNIKVLEILKREILIPVCPEQLGGLRTPRPPQEIRCGSGGDVLEGKRKVLNKKGEDVTREFIKGAEETLRIAELFNIKEFVGKSGSPSCGCGKIYDGSFTGKIVKGDGVTSALLKRSGIRVFTEEDL